MANRFLETLFTPAVRRAQAHYYGRERPPLNALERDPLGDDERAFIETLVAPLKRRIAELEANTGPSTGVT
jgi:hypothetical protein